MFRFLTAGESHGKGMVAFLEGIPAGLELDGEFINAELTRRQGGYGRSERQEIERDRVEFLAGVRSGRTMGSPLALLVPNRDARIDEMPLLTDLRPGHADIPGAAKLLKKNVRDVAERASGRETAARVAAGAVCRLLLREFGIEVFAHVTEIGGIRATEIFGTWEELRDARSNSPFHGLDPKVTDAWKSAVDEAREKGDTLGGVFVVHARGVPPGLGDYGQWDRRLDARLAGALMSIPSVKGVEIGPAFENAGLPGSAVHDRVAADEAAPFGLRRATNRAGGIEGGMADGEEILARCAVKPIPTLGREGGERHDTCAVPAVSVVGEAMIALVLTEVFSGSFGQATVEETRLIYKEWTRRRRDFFRGSKSPGRRVGP